MTLAFLRNGNSAVVHGVYIMSWLLLGRTENIHSNSTVVIIPFFSKEVSEPQDIKEFT